MTTFSVLRTFIQTSTTGFDLNLFVDPTEQILIGVPSAPVSIRLLNPSEVTTTPAPPGAYDGSRFRIVRTSYSTTPHPTEVYSGATGGPSLRTLTSIGQWAEFVWAAQGTGGSWWLVAAGNLS